MNKIYEIKLPANFYRQLIGEGLLILLLLRGIIGVRDDTSYLFFLALFCILLSVVAMFTLVRRLVKWSSSLEMTTHEIMRNHIKISAQEIEKIIIQGYFSPSIGIKLYSKTFVPSYLHFRFKNDEEANIEELKQWASTNSIKVTNGNVMKWL